MQPWWSDERCWNFVPAWKHNPQVKEFLSLGSSDRGLICHCDDALSKSFGPFLSRDKLRKWLQWRWTEQIRQLVTGPRVSLAGQQMPLQLSPRSSSLKHGRRPKNTRFQPLDPPRKLLKGTFFGRKKSSHRERWGCPGLWVVVLTSLVWAARSGPLLQSYWADRPASSLVRLFLTLYTTPSLPPSL